MSFGHPSQHGHMMAGVQKALASSKTPAHLKPHLEARMKTFKGKPITGSKTQMKPMAPAMTPSTSAQAEKQIAAPPMPFKSKMGPAMAPTSSGYSGGSGGNGASKNPNGVKRSAPKKGNAAFFGGR